MDFRKEYTKETGRTAYSDESSGRYNGTYSDDYVYWLENKLNNVNDKTFPVEIETYQKAMKSFEELHKTGLLLFVNQFLQIFGLSLVIHNDMEGRAIYVSIDTIPFKGFDDGLVTDAYHKVERFMKKIKAFPDEWNFFKYPE